MDRFIRNEELLSKEVIEDIYSSSILIVGLGGVGSFACEAIARLGFNTIFLIDRDTYEKSNLNRQLGALESTLSFPKVEVMRNRIYDINPNANVITLKERYDINTFSKLSSYKIDYVIDAIDEIGAKWILIKDCLNNNIPFVSAGGMAKKENSDNINVTRLDKTTYDPISKQLRLLARKEKYDLKKIHVCIQSEKSVINSNSTLLPSIIFAPAIAGLKCAEFILKIIKDKNKKA